MRLRPRKFAWVLMLALVAAGCGPRPAARTGADPPAPAVEPPAQLAENVPTTLLVAAALLEAGEYQQALTLYEYAFEQDPQDVDVGLRTARAALLAGQTNRSLQVLSRLRESHPDDVEVGMQGARLHLYMGEVAVADSLAKMVLAHHPDEPPALRLRMETLEQLARFEEAAQIASRLVDLGEEEPANLLVRQSRLWLQAGRVEPAEQALRRALDLDPAAEDAAEQLVAVLIRTGRNDEVIPLLESLVERTPDSSAHRVGLADAYLGRGEASKAAELLLPLGTRGGLDAKSQLMLAQLLLMLDRPEEAWGLVSQSMQDGLQGPLALRLAGDIQMEMGHVDEAEQYLRQALEARPSDVETVLSLLLLTSRKYPDVVRGDSDVPQAVQEEFGQWLAGAMKLVDLDNVRQVFLVGALLRRASRDEEALEYLGRAAELDPGNPQILFDLAVSQESTGRYREAQASLEALLQVDPDDAQVLNFLGYLLADQGWELARAQTLIEQALEQDPDNAFYLDSLGWVYYRTGRYEDALEKLIDASNTLGDDPTVLEHIGDTLVALGDYERALSIYEQALSAGGDHEDLTARIENVRQRLREAP